MPDSSPLESAETLTAHQSHDLLFAHEICALRNLGMFQELSHIFRRSQCIHLITKQTKFFSVARVRSHDGRSRQIVMRVI